MKTSALFCLALFAITSACERDPIVTDLAPLSPTAQVVGIVENALTSEPLSGFSVEIIGGPSVTGADGRFSIDAVVAGPSIPVVISAPGFVDAVFLVDVASVGGVQENALTGIGPIGLLPLLDDDQASRLRVLTDEGAPVDDVSIEVVLDRAFLNAGLWQGTRRGEAAFDSNGEYNLRGLPDLALVAAIAPDANLNLVVRPPSDRSDLGLYVRSVELSTFFESAPFVVNLPAVVSARFRLVNSNLEELIENQRLESPSVLATDEPMELGFTRPLEISEIRVETPAAINPLPVSADGDVNVTFRDAEAGAQFPVTITVPTEDFSRTVDIFTQTPAEKSFGDTPYSVVGVQALCPTQAGQLVLELNAQIGGRNIRGEQAPNYSTIEVSVAGLTLEAVPQVGESGFTNLLNLQWPGVENPVGTNPATVTFAAPIAGELQLMDPSGTPYQNFDTELQLDVSLCN